MTNEEAKRYMQSKYNCDLLTINGVVFVPLYQIIDRIEQPAPAVPLDRIKAAREEVANYSDFHREHLYKTNPNYDVEQGQYLAYEKCLQILDKLIAESEG